MSSYFFTIPKAENDREKIDSIQADALCEDDMLQFEIDGIITTELTGEATRLFVPVPPRDDSKLWKESVIGGDERKYLSDEGISHLREAIREEKKKRHEIRAAYIEVVVKFVAILTGLVGACIALIAILRN